MPPHIQAYVYAISASACFSSASLVFAHYSKKISSKWMNFFKATVCFVLMTVTLLITRAWQPLAWPATIALMVSGAVGLGLGDLFLLQAYARMGAGRTLVLFGFEPLFLGVASWYLFHQDFSMYRLISILFFLLCLFLFSLEKYKERGHWEIIGLLAALIGVLCDNAGVLLTRWAFESQHQLQPLQANFIRCAGSMVFFIFCSPFLKAQLFAQFRALNTKQRWIVTGAAIAGTYFSLLLYISAIRVGHLASIGALAVCGPIFATSLECIVYKKRPSIYLLLALLSFLTGFAILLSF